MAVLVRHTAAVARGLVLLLASCTHRGSMTQPPPVLPEAAPQVDRSSGEVFMVQGKAVDRHAFESFEASTTQVPGTWYCDEMSDGGETGWDATDARGAVYEVRYIQDVEGVINTINPKSR